MVDGTCRKPDTHLIVMQMFRRAGNHGQARKGRLSVTLRHDFASMAKTEQKTGQNSQTPTVFSMVTPLRSSPGGTTGQDHVVSGSGSR